MLKEYSTYLITFKVNIKELIQQVYICHMQEFYWNDLAEKYRQEEA